MELQQLLNELGVQSVAAASAAIARFQAFMTFLMTAVGVSDPQLAMDTVKAKMASLQSIEASVGASGAAAIAKIEAWKANSERVIELEGKVAAQMKATQDRDAHEAIAKACTDGRLMPAMRERAEKLYAELGLEGLKTFLAALPVSSAKGPRQPTRADSSVDQSVHARLLAKGFTAEEIAAAEALPVVLSYGEED